MGSTEPTPPLSIPGTCTRCGGSRLEPGSARSPAWGSHGLFFRLSRVKGKFWTPSSNDIKVNATMCLDCGLIELAGNVATAHRLIAEQSRSH